MTIITRGGGRTRLKWGQPGYWRQECPYFRGHDVPTIFINATLERNFWAPARKNGMRVKRVVKIGSLDVVNFCPYFS